MKKIIFILVMLIPTQAFAISAFVWKTPALVSGLTYTNVKLHCTSVSSSTFTLNKTLSVSKTSLSVFSSPLSGKSGKFKCYMTSFGYLNTDPGKTQIESRKSSEIQFELLNGSLVVASPVAPTGFGIRP